MKRNYLDPKVLTAEVIKSQQQDRMTEELANMVLLITTKVLTRFHTTVNVEEAGQASILQVMRYLHHINPDKSAFSYITSIIKSQAALLKRKDDAWYRAAGSEVHFEGRQPEDY